MLSIQKRYLGTMFSGGSFSLCSFFVQVYFPSYPLLKLYSWRLASIKCHMLLRLAFFSLVRIPQTCFSAQSADKGDDDEGKFLSVLFSVDSWCVCVCD